LETRRATDEFATRLTVNNYNQNGNFAQNVEVSLETSEETLARRSYLSQIAELIGWTPSKSKLSAEAHEDEAPIAFTYSLFYVYYDQYTYINGVCFQNVAIGVGVIIVLL
jgi:hypothetical protein